MFEAIGMDIRRLDQRRPLHVSVEGSVAPLSFGGGDVEHPRKQAVTTRSVDDEVGLVSAE